MDKTIQQLIQESTKRPLNSNEEKHIVASLRSISEEEACVIIESMIDQKSQVTLDIPSKVLHQKEYVKKLFRHALQSANAQSIQSWLAFAIPKLGFKSVVRIIEEEANDENRLVEKSIYWLPSVIPQNEKGTLEALERLRKISEKGKFIYIDRP